MRCIKIKQGNNPTITVETSFLWVKKQTQYQADSRLAGKCYRWLKLPAKTIVPYVMSLQLDAWLRAGKPKNKWRTWTPDDDLTLERLYPYATSAALVEILDRSIHTIRVRASGKNLKRLSVAAAAEKSNSAFKRAANADGYQPIVTMESVESMSPAAFRKDELIATMEANARFLRDTGHSWLANLTGAVIEQITQNKSYKQLSFLTIARS